MNFEFEAPNRIVFGWGEARALGMHARGFGCKVLVLTGKNSGRYELQFSSLKQHEIEYRVFSVPAEPTTELAWEAIQLARSEKCDLIIGIGGGSVLDTSKVVAALAANQGRLIDYLEVIGQGRPLAQPSIPCIAVPTTAGTGSEATKNAVLKSVQHQVKVSMRSPYLLPRLALVDPELTFSVSAHITAATGLDAATQLIEPFVAKRANPLTDSMCREGLRCVARSLRRCFENGADKAARTDMSLGALLSGMALANAGLGAVHGFSGTIGAVFSAPHGMVCASLLPHVMRINLAALKDREPQSAIIAKYHELAQILTGNPRATADDGICFIEELCQDLKIQGLKNYGLSEKAFEAVIAQSKKASSMKANPIVLTDQEMRQVLARALS